MRTVYELNMLVKRMNQNGKVFLYKYHIGWIKSLSALAYPIYESFQHYKKYEKQIQKACRQIKPSDKLYTTQHEGNIYL